MTPLLRKRCWLSALVAGSRRSTPSASAAQRLRRPVRLGLEVMEDRTVPANLSIPSNIAAFRSGTVAVPVIVDTLSDGTPANQGLSRADLAINYDPAVLTFGQAFPGTALVSGGFAWTVTPTTTPGQLRVAVSSPTGG